MSKLHILSYNIHKGFNLTNRSHVLSDIKKSIQTVGADLVLLQEVLGQHETHKKNILDWPLTSQFEFLADTIWPHFAYGKNAIYSEGHHGNAILSKYPITSYQNINISTNRFEQRGFLYAKINILTVLEEIHVICVHLDIFETGRNKQLEQICGFIENNIPQDAPLILGGDFNDWRGSATPILGKRLGLFEAFWIQEGQHARTFPAAFPILKLDRIYTRKLTIEKAVVMHNGIWTELSDHAPISVEFKL